MDKRYSRKRSSEYQDDFRRQELERQTRETQKLQEEVEQATQSTRDKMKHSYHEEPLDYTHATHGASVGGASSSLLSSHSMRRPSLIRCSLMDMSTISSGLISPTKSNTSKYDPELEASRRSSVFSGKQHLESVMEEYSLKVKDLQRRLNESNEINDQQKFHFRQTIIDLQTKIQELEMERDAITDIRRRESKSQENINGQLQNTIEELERANQLQEEMLKECNLQIEKLKNMVHSNDEALHEIRTALITYENNTGNKVYEHDSISSINFRNLGSAVNKVLREMDSEVSFLKERLIPVEDQLEALKRESQSKVELLISQSEEREQAQNQSAMYMLQLADLDTTVSHLRSELREGKRMYTDKIEDLEKKLTLANSELNKTRNERDQFNRESGTLDDQLQKLLADLHKAAKELSLEKDQNKRLRDRDAGNSITIDHLRRELDSRNAEVQRLESQLKTVKDECQGQLERQMAAIHGKKESLEKVSALNSQLESTKENLHKVAEELTAKKVSLENCEKSMADLTARLQDKDQTIEAVNTEIKKLHSREDNRKKEVQQLKFEVEQLRKDQSEIESLMLHVGEKDRVIQLLRDQIANMTQIVGQHSQKAGAMQVEKAQLLKEASDRKLELQEFKMAKEKRDARIRELEARLSDVELEKMTLVNCGSQTFKAVSDLKLERDQLVTALKVSRHELAALSEEYEVLKRSHKNKNEEVESTASKLKMQLKAAQYELEQTKSTLKTLEGSDAHAMKVAMGMQKQITAKRGQIDALQSKIQYLEEAMENSNKDKHYLKEEKLKLSQELSRVEAEKSKMALDLEIFRSHEQRLREKIASMETALEKVSLQFSECQAIIQRQEQDSMRLKLQHTLDMKEVQGPGHTVCSTCTKQRYLPMSSSRPPSASLPTCQTCKIPASANTGKDAFLKENPTHDLKLLLSELRSVIYEAPNLHMNRTRGQESGREETFRTPPHGQDTGSEEMFRPPQHGQDSRSGESFRPPSRRQDTGSEEMFRPLLHHQDTGSEEVFRPLLHHQEDTRSEETFRPLQHRQDTGSVETVRPLQNRQDTVLEETFRPLQHRQDTGSEETFKPLQHRQDTGSGGTFRPLQHRQDTVSEGSFRPLQHHQDTGSGGTFRPLQHRQDTGSGGTLRPLHSTLNTDLEDFTIESGNIRDSYIRDNATEDFTIESGQIRESYIRGNATEDFTIESGKLRESGSRDKENDSFTIESGRLRESCSRNPSTLHTMDLEDGRDGFSFTQHEIPSRMSSTPSYASPPKKFFHEDRHRTRSPVHSLLAPPIPILASTGITDIRPPPRNTITRPVPNLICQPAEITGKTCDKLQIRLEGLQNLVEDLQLKNQEMSTMIKNQERRMRKVKDQENMLMK